MLILVRSQNQKVEEVAKINNVLLSNRPVIEGRVALFPRTFKCLLDFSSPPSTTLHFTVSFVFDITANDIIPPKTKKIISTFMSDMKLKT